ncbi:MAG: hypothetical protein AVDCRST_MAG23-2676 [uncultured Sphingosinicella sp.]|uniref:Uncharacterized protein n=1 Tax=uncultured Sphingosinicella sp. TaxID=478748 RepID=A0A6J4UE18_9SPHN|nr:MAG: hypothetical protein AVDCRST_MAG23-2676 [uncultured Sphingosinicella sp.]
MAAKLFLLFGPPAQRERLSFSVSKPAAFPLRETKAAKRLRSGAMRSPLRVERPH